MNFADIPSEFSALENSEIVILPVPFDISSSWGHGSDKGPAAIIEASSHMELYDIETGLEVYKRGIYTAGEIISDSPDRLIQSVEKEMDNYLEKGKFVVLLGGEHTVSIAPVKSVLKKYPDISVLHLDAHADKRDSYEDNRYSHACVMARITELVTKPVISVGIRSMDISEKEAVKAENTFFAEDITADDEWIDSVVSKLGTNVYVTIDLDVFDPSVMPSTGTPEPGGLDWYTVLRLLKKVAAERTTRAFDVVELCPNSNNSAPDFLASKLIYKFLSYIYLNRS